MVLPAPRGPGRGRTRLARRGDRPRYVFAWASPTAGGASASPPPLTWSPWVPSPDRRRGVETLGWLRGGRVGTRCAEALPPVPVLGRLAAGPHLQRGGLGRMVQFKPIVIPTARFSWAVRFEAG